MAKTEKIVRFRLIFPIFFWFATVVQILAWVFDLGLSGRPSFATSLAFIGMTGLATYWRLFGYCRYDDSRIQFMGGEFLWRDAKYISRFYNMFYVDFGNRGILFHPFMVQSFGQTMTEIYLKIVQNDVSVELDARSARYFGRLEMAMKNSAEVKRRGSRPRSKKALR